MTIPTANTSEGTNKSDVEGATRCLPTDCESNEKLKEETCWSIQKKSYIERFIHDGKGPPFNISKWRKQTLYLNIQQFVMFCVFGYFIGMFSGFLVFAVGYCSVNLFFHILVEIYYIPDLISSGTKNGAIENHVQTKLPRLIEEARIQMPKNHIPKPKLPKLMEDSCIQIV